MECGASDVSVMVIHNKKKEKRGKFPKEMKYFVGEEIEDVWVVLLHFKRLIFEGCLSLGCP
jgi:hypothetical protein